MDKRALMARKSAYLEELADIEENITIYGNPSFSMNKRSAGGTLVNVAPEMLAHCVQAKKTYEAMIAIIDGQIADLDAG